MRHSLPISASYNRIAGPGDRGGAQRAGPLAGLRRPVPRLLMYMMSFMTPPARTAVWHGFTSCSCSRSRSRPSPRRCWPVAPPRVAGLLAELSAPRRRIAITQGLYAPAFRGVLGLNPSGRGGTLGHLCAAAHYCSSASRACAPLLRRPIPARLGSTRTVWRRSRSG